MVPYASMASMRSLDKSCQNRMVYYKSETNFEVLSNANFQGYEDKLFRCSIQVYYDMYLGQTTALGDQVLRLKHASSLASTSRSMSIY